MAYICHYCRQESGSGHTITIYDKSGVEERLEVLCDLCYEEWLLSLKG